jgi:DNA polymerase-3 subunit gamma/tau
VGKTTCARIFAKTINCFNPTADGEACNECESCRSFNENRSLNIHELDAASNNSVDDIRSLTEQVRIPPQIGKYKVYIIDEVHMLSSQAFNAFLKTLEEPPHYAIFILATTEKHKILPTILSRCQVYDFNRISINDIVEYLEYVAGQENVKTEKEALNVIAQKADGGMRDALSIFDQVVSFSQGNVTYKTVIENLNVLDYDYYFRMVGAMLENRVPDCLLLLNEILSKGFDGQHIVSGLGLFFRDLLVCRDPQTIALFESGEAVKARYQELSQKCTLPFLYRAMEITNETDLNYQYSKNKRFAIELMLIRLCQSNNPQPEGEDKKKIEQINVQPAATTPQLTKTGAEALASSSKAPKGRVETGSKTNAEPAPESLQPVSLGLNGLKNKAAETPEEKKSEVKVENQTLTSENPVKAWNGNSEKKVKEILYTDKDKVQYMAEKNPLLYDLVKEFNIQV